MSHITGKIKAKNRADLEEGMKKALHGHRDFNFDYFGGNKVLVSSKKDTTPDGKIELTLFAFSHWI